MVASVALQTGSTRLEPRDPAPAASVVAVGCSQSPSLEPSQEPKLEPELELAPQPEPAPQLATPLVHQTRHKRARRT